LLFLVLAVTCATLRVGSALGAHARMSLATARGRVSLVSFARRFIGVRYVYGGTSPSGFDCSGFTRYVFAHFGITLPHFAAAQFALGQRVSRAALRPGDLVFFDGLGHVGLYLGGNRFIHAPHTGTRVEVSSLDGWYSTRYDGARRY
jgi:cell wall-associated NlpC family hydrolase